MALDTRIPLGIEQVNLANPLATLMQTRQNTQDRATAAADRDLALQDRQREIARQSQQDVRQKSEFEQNTQLNAAKIDEFKNNKATQQYLQDSLTVKNLLESNNPQDAALVVQGMQERFKGTDYASGLDQDLANINAGNLEPVLSGINSEIQAFQEMQNMTSGRAAQQDPAAVREYQFLQTLTPEQQQQFMIAKRATPAINLGDRAIIADPTNPAAAPIAQFQRGLPPEATPVTRGQQEAAVQAARTAALPAQLAAENAAAIEQEGAMATAPRQRDAEATLSLLDMAEPLLDTATGSGLGNLRDQAGALVGISNPGAESAAQLKAIGGLLVSKMPRMQGPQSNLDVQLYREMAGQIGDPTVPNEVRRAAIATIRQLNEKYAGQSPATAQPNADIFTQADAILNGL